jgi:surface polysaccharide O-acyltransferase-like enzyme
MIPISLILLVVSLFFNIKAVKFLSSLVTVLALYVNMPSKSCKMVEFIDKNSFGIYLFHSPLVYITYSTIPNQLPIIVCFVNFCIFGTLACLLTIGMRRFKLKRLIGE